MKILLDKPAPVPSNTNNSAQASDSMLDMLTACLFSNTLNNMQEKTEPGVDEAGSQQPEVNEDMLQQDIDAIMSELMQQLVKNEPEQRQEQPVQMDSVAFDFAANKFSDKSAGVFAAETKQPEADNKVLATNPDNTALIKQLPPDSNPEESYNQDAQHHANDKSDKYEAVTQKKLTASVKLSETIQNTNEMNELAMKNPMRDTSTQSAVVHKTLHHWVDKLNSEAPALTPAPVANPVMTPMPQAEAVKPQNLILNQQAAASKAAPQEPMHFHLDTVEADPAQPNSYKVVIKISPPELGPVHATLKMDKNKVEIKIVTTNLHAEQVIKHHIAALSDQFNKSAMQLDKIEIQQQSALSLNYDQTSDSGSKYKPDEAQGQTDVTTTAPKQPNDKSNKKSEALIDAYI